MPELDDSIQELQDKKASVERQLNILNLRKERRDERAAAAAENALYEKIGAKAYGGSDYAGLYCNGYHFYYGYESTICPFHGNDTECDCAEKTWAFVVNTEDDEKELFRMPENELGMDKFSVASCLLHGIGLFLNMHAIFDV